MASASRSTNQKSSIVSSNQKDWQIRFATSEDRGSILDLHKTVFGKELSAAQWDWQFEKNPTQSPIVSVAVTNDGQVVGHHALIPVPFACGNETTMAVFSILSMVHPDFQRQGMLKRLAEHSKREVERRGIAHELTFLNDNSLPVYTRYLGWKEIGKRPPIYFRLLSAEPLFVRVLGKNVGTLIGKISKPLLRLIAPLQIPSTHELTFRKLERFDETAPQIFQQWKSEKFLGTDRTSSYLNWRIFDHPNHYEVIGAYFENQLAGFVVFRREEKFGVQMGYLVELLYNPKNPQWGARLLAEACYWLREEGASIVTSLVPPTSQLKSVFVSQGFRSLPRVAMPHGMHFCIRSTDTGVSEALPENWYLSWSDHDIP